MLKSLTRLRTADHGATAIEYGLILALICMGMLGGLELLGGEVISGWATIMAAVLSS